jgi:predicted RNA-binding protein with PUA-like domain
MPPCWLMKAEPDSRIDPRTGVDVKFGLDDFRASKDQTTSWEGVRNAGQPACRRRHWNLLLTVRHRGGQAHA